MVNHRARPVEASHYAMTPRPDLPRSVFHGTPSFKFTGEPNLLIPFYIDEVLPGDSHRVKASIFGRTSTAIVPMMDNLILETFYFFVPNRLVWEHWDEFITGRNAANPSDTTVYLLPQCVFTAAHLVACRVADYFGVYANENAGASLSVNALPFRAYQLIWNEWFRDENLITALTVPISDGPDSGATMNRVLERGKRHDYFTTALPWPQKPMSVQEVGGPYGPLVPGSPRMTMGVNFAALGAGAPVSGLGVATNATPTHSVAATIAVTGGRTQTVDDFFNSSTAAFRMASGPTTALPDVRVLVNDIRTALTVQAMLERNARGGSRYVETILSHFGVRSPDARMQRPEYLGGGRSFINIQPIAQTSGTGADGTTTVLGELSGIGTVMAHDHKFSQSFTEHGHVIGLMCVRSDLTYQNGTARMWWRRSQFDFYWPSLAHLGEQAVLQGEIYSDGTSADTGTVFGYQERWAEYRTMIPRVAGFFRSNHPQTLDIWHLSQNFSPAPTLSEAFIIESVPIDRVLQNDVNFGQSFLFDVMFDVTRARVMPAFSIPGLGARL